MFGRQKGVGLPPSGLISNNRLHIHLIQFLVIERVLYGTESLFIKNIITGLIDSYFLKIFVFRQCAFTRGTDYEGGSL